MDQQKIKELTSGVAFVTASANYDNTMVQEDRECLLVITCNDFPKIDAVDQAVIRRRVRHRIPTQPLADDSSSRS